MLRRLLATTWAALGLAWSAHASAHAFLDHASPRVGSTVHGSPPDVRLWFTQELEPAFSTLSVQDAGGHGVAGALRVATDMVHLVAAGAWVGALPGLALALTVARRHANEGMLAYAGRATRRFSVLGAISVSALIASGVGNAIDLVGGWSALIDTRYGILLVAKLAFVAVMLALAAVNLSRLGPQVGRSDARAAQALARNAVLETLGGAAVIAIVGVLGITVPGEHAGHARLHSDTSRAIIPHSSPRHPHG
ncbi:MAG TPA: CopD family protein [Casimicrobiaceae bacterium]|nr:CopD family protein [Casimicrobiaceae bacterium]